MIFFFGKNFVLKFVGQKKPKIKFFKFYEKSMYGSFLIFCLKLQQHKTLNWFKLFLGGKSYTGFLDKKGPKMNFLILITNWCILFSDFLHEGTIAKWARNKSFQVLWEIWKFLWKYFGWIYSRIKGLKLLEAIVFWGKMLVCVYQTETILINRELN